MSFRYHNNFDALVWLDTSAEQHALYLQAFALARLRVEEFLARPTPASRDRKLCVITDCDESILDNSAFNAWLVRYGQVFSDEGWDLYCKQGLARETAGSVEFARWLQSQGIELFYVTSRSHGTRAETARNLEKLGFPVSPADKDPNADPGTQRLFLKGMKLPGLENTKKFLQYSFIQETLGYYPILWMGDNLGDFSPAYNFKDSSNSAAVRLARAASLDKEQWGKRWIVFPNPVYGDYQQSLVVGGKLLKDDDQPTYSPTLRKVRDAIDLDEGPKLKSLELWDFTPPAGGTAPPG